jgi:alkylated DNA repair dioxygenase AlkB
LLSNKVQEENATTSYNTMEANQHERKKSKILKFKRPPKGSKTTYPHIYVSNGGDKEQLERTLKKISVSTTLELPSEILVHSPLVTESVGSHCYVSFGSSEDAIVILEALRKLQFDDSTTSSSRRRLIVEFAQAITEEDLETKEHLPKDISLTRDIIVPDLLFIENFVTQEEEEDLMNFLDSQPWNEGPTLPTSPFDPCSSSTSSSSSSSNSPFSIGRRVQHYGFAFNYKTRIVDPNQPLGFLPSAFDFILNRLPTPFRPDQITVNEYLPGQGIASHVDTHSAFEDGITSLSLCSSVVMDFECLLSSSTSQSPSTSVSSSNYVSGTRVQVEPCAAIKNQLLPARSLLVMVGESRYAWKHGIAYRRTDNIAGRIVPRTRRVSLTLRKIRTPPFCYCKYPLFCDYQLQQQQQQQQQQ